VRGPTAADQVPDRRERAELLYEQARALPPESRAPFVEGACREDPELTEELVALLANAEDAEVFFQHMEQAVISLRSSAALEQRKSGSDGALQLSSGSAVGRYRILARIGTGGMGAVYRAHDTRLHRDVALKFLPPDLTGALDAEERFLVEARAAAALEHPNVCTVYEIAETEDGRPFIAMASYEGETLKERLRRGPLPPAAAVDVAIQTARGLAAAHAHGIVHRDVKPGNIMLTTDGTVKLLDFGLAKVADVSITRSGLTPGTVAYMSPEQTRGDPVDRRADLWSLGVVLYEMLTGVRPFRGGNDPAIVQAILHSRPDPLSRRTPSVPDSLDRIVERLLQKKRERRYGAVDELLRDLTSAPPIQPVAPGQSRRPVNARYAAPVATGVLAAFAILHLVRAPPESRRPAAVGPTRPAAPAIAVLPFTVRGQGLEVWREGMVDLLSIGLDGAGGLRAIDNRTLLARWNEEVGQDTVTDLARALQVARRSQARYALVGSAVGAGPQIRLVAEVYDVGSNQSMGQAQVQGSPDSVLALVDALGMQALRIVLEKEPAELPAVDLAGVTTSSLVALKAYLEGEARFRRAALPAAVAAWERAVRLDSSFALAYAGLAEAYGWDETRDWPKGAQMLGRAHQLTARLPTREATLVRTRWALREDRAGALAAIEEAVREYPDDAEAWYSLGEAYYHGAGAMQGSEEAESVFRRAVELQPGAALYRAHLLDLAFGRRPDSARVAREVEAYGRLAPTRAVRARASRIAFALAFGDSGARAGARVALDTLDRESAVLTYMFLSHPRFAAARETVFGAVDPGLDERAWYNMGLLRFGDLGLMDGQVRRALAIAEDPRASAYVRYCGPFHLSIRGLHVPEQALEARLAVSSADSSSFSERAWVTCAAAYAAQRGRWGDHALLLSRAREVVGRRLAAGDSTSAREWDRAVREAEAHGLWRRGQKQEALRAFEGVLSSDAIGWRALWYVGRLAFELGQLDLAERAFRALWGWDGAVAELQLGRIYERAGRTAEALEAYRFVTYAWRNADPELEPVIVEVQDAVASLSDARD
jgi:tetratricopeptide (TPR) repeat protein